MDRLLVLLVALLIAGATAGCSEKSDKGTGTTSDAQTGGAQPGTTGDSTTATGSSETPPAADATDYTKFNIDDNIKTASTALQAKDYVKAEKALLVARDQAENMLHQNARKAVILNMLGTAYEERQMYYEAIPVYNQAQRLFIREFGTQHIAVPKTLLNLARVLTKQHRYVEAWPVYKSAVELMETNKQTGDPVYPQAVRDYVTALEKSGKGAKAAEVAKKLEGNQSTPESGEHKTESTPATGASAKVPATSATAKVPATSAATKVPATNTATKVAPPTKSASSK